MDDKPNSKKTIKCHRQNIVYLPETNSRIISFYSGDIYVRKDYEVGINDVFELQTFVKYNVQYFVDPYNNCKPNEVLIYKKYCPIEHIKFFY